MEKEFEDFERALLFFYLFQKGLPPWAQGGNHAKALAIVAGWDEARAEEAIKAAHDKGFIDRTDWPTFVGDQES